MRIRVFGYAAKLKLDEVRLSSATIGFDAIIFVVPRIAYAAKCDA
jgi:hypothetical protein